MSRYCYDHPRPSVATDVAVFRINAGRLEVLLIRRKEAPIGWALPGGFLRVGPPEVESAVAQGQPVPHEVDDTLEACARRELDEEAGVRPLRLHQFGTFGDASRDARGRYVSVAFWTFVHETRCRPLAGSDADAVEWRSVDDFDELAFDHKTIVAEALERIHQRQSDLSLFLDLMPDTFTYPEFHRAFEAAIGQDVDRSNLYKRAMSLLSQAEIFPNDHPSTLKRGAHRPARLYALERALDACGATS